MYDKLVLPNGVRIVTQHMPGVRSASIGLWVGVGSRHETRAENGSAHFIEHMLFKTTSNRTTRELALEMDAIGGQINACTTRENTCFYARVLDEHLDKAAELLADMFFNARFDEQEFETERGVVSEEISMYDDEPEDLVSERLLLSVFPGALGRPVAGTLSSVRGFTADSLREFKRRHYIAPRIVVSLCGSFTDDNVRRLAEAFSVLPSAKAGSQRKSVYRPSFTVRHKAVEQNHICLGFSAPPAGSDSRFALQILSTVAGGGMSSRLFQRVREERGLCYSIYSFQASFTDAGLFGIYAGLGRETERQSLQLIRDELLRLREDGVTQRELDCAREQARASILMSLESTAAHMNKLGWGELTLGNVLSSDELLARYEAVTREDVRQAAQQILQPEQMSLSAVGRVMTAEEYRTLLT